MLRYVFTLAPAWLTVLALLVLRLGWSRPSKYRNPSRYRTGVVMLAAGLICLWLVPVCLYLLTDGWQSELRWLVILLGFGLPMGLIGGGGEAIRKANNTPSEDFWEDHF